MNLKTMEPYERLEYEFGELIGNPYTVACSNGTAALHLALEALEMPLHSVVHVPDYTMIACPRSVVMAGMVPLFLDCDDRLLMQPLKESTRKGISWAIMPVHIYGRRCDMVQVHKDSKRLGLYVIEDMSEAPTLTPHTLTDAACWSFYKNKIIAGEEGGMIAFKSARCAELARELRSLGFSKKHDFLHRPRGVNARLSNANASLVLQSLHNLGENLKRRVEVEIWYNELMPKEWQMPARDVPWVYDLRIPSMSHYEQQNVVSKLNELGIEARQGFKPMRLQDEFIQPELPTTIMDSNAYKLSQEVFYLPITPQMSHAGVERNVDVLKSQASD